MQEATKSDQATEGDVESIVLKDISLETESFRNPNDIYIFTHRFGFNLLGEEGQYLNVVTLDSSIIRESEEDIYMPYNFFIDITDIGLKVETRYEINENEASLISFLSKIGYEEIFLNFSLEIVECLQKMGYFDHQ